MFKNHPNIPLLHYLSEHSFQSATCLAYRMRISHTAVLKQIETLKEWGYHIAADPEKGLRIISRPDLLLPDEIQRKLHTKTVGKQVYYFPTIVSTNNFARQAILEKKIDLKEGSIVLAEVQTAGKGRLGRTWFSPKGGLWLTLILFPELEPAYISRITLMTSVVLVKVLNKLYNISAKIKWPNDIIISNKKNSGILTEMSTVSNHIRFVLIGVGMNVNIDRNFFPEKLRSHSISIQDALHQPVDRVALMRLLLENFEKYYNLLCTRQFERIRQEWKMYAYNWHQKIKVSTKGKIITGKVIDLDQQGALVIRLGDGSVRHILSGTVK